MRLKSFIVKLCVLVFLLSLCLSLKVLRTQTDTIMGVPPPTTTENFFWSHMKDMTKIKLFYSGTMVLILPQLKDIVYLIFLECKILTHSNHSKQL